MASFVSVNISEKVAKHTYDWVNKIGNDVSKYYIIGSIIVIRYNWLNSLLFMIYILIIDWINDKLIVLIW